MDTSLFPRGESWGTGDEALDYKLSKALDETLKHLSVQAISSFYFDSLELKTRAYNPSFKQTINEVTKALLSLHLPDAFIDQEFIKIQGCYHAKKVVSFDLDQSEQLKALLLEKKYFRYDQQIDFSCVEKEEWERNPFVRERLKRAPLEFHAKILMKDLRFFLNGEKSKDNYSGELYLSLKNKEQVLKIEGLMSIWFEDDQLFVLTELAN